MTVRVSKPKFNLREKLTELDKPSGLKGTELMRSETSQEVRGLIGADRRNLVINGAMMVAQRGTSSTAIADVGAYGSVDRFQMVGANLDQLAMLQKQTSDGPDGFSKCFEFDVTTPENALDADDLVYMRYKVEGQDLEPFFNANGTGKNFTLSFYVKAYQAGTYQLNIYKSDGPRFITRTYTISSSGVWQRVVLNFPGDGNTTGMLQTTGAGFNISWIFAAGTNYTSGSQSTNWGGWPGNPGFAAGHAVNSASSANNYFRITGVQLEVGNIATEFEHRSFGEELALCQRYCQAYGSKNPGDIGGRIAHGTWSNGTQARATIHLPVQMRAIPSIHSYTAGHVLREAIDWYGVSGVGISESTKTHCTFIYSFSSSSGASANEFATWGNGAGVVIEAEL